MWTRTPDLAKGVGVYLLNGGRPGEGETEEDDEEEGPPQVPVPERLAGVLAVGVREDDELEVADDAGEVSLDGVPHGLGERVGRRAEAVSADGDGNGGGRGRHGGDGDRDGGSGERGLRKDGRRGRGGGDRDGGARRGGRPRGEYRGRGGRGVDQALDLVHVGLRRRRVERDRVAVVVRHAGRRGARAGEGEADLRRRVVAGERDLAGGLGLGLEPWDSGVGERTLRWGGGAGTHVSGFGCLAAKDRRIDASGVSAFEKWTVRSC